MEEKMVRRKNSRGKNPLDEPVTIEDAVTVEQHRFKMTVAKLFVFIVTTGFLILFSLFIFSLFRNKEGPDSEMITSLFGNFFSILSIIFGV